MDLISDPSAMAKGFLIDKFNSSGYHTWDCQASVTGKPVAWSSLIFQSTLPIRTKGGNA